MPPDTAEIPAVVVPAVATRKPLWRSRKFWLALLAAAIPVVNEAFGLHLSVEGTLEAMGPIMALGAHEAVADWLKVWHEAKADGAIKTSA